MARVSSRLGAQLRREFKASQVNCAVLVQIRLKWLEANPHIVAGLALDSGYGTGLNFEDSRFGLSPRLIRLVASHGPTKSAIARAALRVGLRFIQMEDQADA